MPCTDDRFHLWHPPAARGVREPAIQRIEAGSGPPDRASRQPLYRQIYEGYREATLDGRLRTGERLHYGPRRGLRSFRESITAYLRAARGVRWASDIAPSTFLQAVLADLLDEGHFASHLRRIRKLYRERRGTLVDALHYVLGYGGTRVEEIPAAVERLRRAL